VPFAREPNHRLGRLGDRLPGLIGLGTGDVKGRLGPPDQQPLAHHLDIRRAGTERDQQ
jgi:hypothetical protein